MYIQSEIEFDSDFRPNIFRNQFEKKKYPDGCFIIFTRTEEELKKFNKFLNTLHPSIKFTIAESKICLPFLDTHHQSQWTTAIRHLFMILPT